MDRMIYTGMAAASESFHQQAVLAGNIANISTPGFRAQLDAMKSMEVQGDGLKTRTLAYETTPGADFTMGPIQTTGRNLDVALEQNAWLAVQTQDGREAYTKNGDIQVDRNGQMLIGGRPVVGDNGPINVPLDSEVSIGPDGTISVIEAGQGPTTIAQAGKLKMVKAGRDELVRGDDGLFRSKPDAQGVSQPLAANEDMRLTAGALEGSNVSPTSSMVDMIASQRRYDMNMKTISTANDNAQRANDLFRIS
ncbi:flagellar basal-body rod protein FlgF [Pseudomonas nitritireducens]|uniref:Flagellar basal-body rod protein FlgF n=1 Tax=Pseudomonas nitroreducens TaxID=46680 RepID=A0A7W7KMS6_PSENT|nr:flagellar basal body rod protein FlgF [Pseudomonas nitritireducens]MBB4865366.1 flagellar basal-body rod protein FlgF [Pseudomonas nitritireducens]